MLLYNLNLLQMSDDRFGCLTMMLCVMLFANSLVQQVQSRFQFFSGFSFELIERTRAESVSRMDCTYILISYSRCDEAFEICSLTILESFDHLKVVFLFNAMMLINCFKGRSVLCLSFWLQDAN